MAHRQQGCIFKQKKRLTDGTLWESPNYSIMYRVGAHLKAETIGPKKKEAAQALADRLKALHEGTYREIKVTTFREWAETWRRGLGSIKPSTARAYRSILERHMIPAFGDRLLTTLGVEDVNAYLGEREGDLKPKTRRNHLTLLHKILDDAREAGYLAVNRLSGSKALHRPKAIREEDEREVEILDAGEVNRLLDALKELKGGAYYPLFLAGVFTGMRLGELLSLQWGDIDWQRKQVRVRRSAYKGEFFVPKTKRSRRAIDVGDQLLDVLHGLQLGRYGETALPADDLIFCGHAGAMLDPDNLRKRVWAPALVAAKLRHVVIHSLRHTYASLLIAQGESPKYISSQLGHASVQITFDRYGHLFPNEKRTSAARLEQRLGLTITNKFLAIGAGLNQTEPNEREAEVPLSGENIERS
jgi:integrase